MRAEFNLDPKFIYLNSGTQSICPKSVNAAITRYQAEYDQNPTLGYIEAWGKLWRVQKELAAFFNGSACDFFLRPNVTAAMNQFILGAPLRAGSEILHSNMEYGAIVNICQLRAQNDSLKLRQFELRTASKKDLIDSVVSALRPETSLLLLSHVFTGNGTVLPLIEIARETRQRGILLAVDGAHAPGALKLDFSLFDDVDFYGGNMHKWMMGPNGTGFGWVNPRQQAALRPLQAGWTTFEAAEPFSDFGDGSRFASKFALMGCHDFAPYLALNDTFEFWKRHGEDKIIERIYSLQHLLEREVSAHLGWPCLSPATALRGPLLSYALPAHLEPRGYGLMKELLETHGLQVSITRLSGFIPMGQSPGKWIIRLSPHVYNTEDEIHRSVQILKSL